MYDEVLNVLKGKVVGKPEISIWRHYPKFDFDIEKLVKAHTKDLQRFPSDLIKLSPHGKYSVVDFGCTIRPGSVEEGDQGSSKCIKCVVEKAEDWEKIEEIDVMAGQLGEQVKYVEQMRRSFPQHPIMMTVFTPTMTSQKLSKSQFSTYLAQETEGLQEAFNVISQTTIEFARACIDAGADGIFSAIQEADRSLITDPDLLQLMIKMNKPFMSSLKTKAKFIVLHLHGDDVSFKQAVEYYKPTAVNWHDRTGKPSLMDASELFSGGLLGGLSPETVLEGTHMEDLRDMNNLYSSIPLIIAPGCVLLQGTPENHIHQIFDFFKE